MHNEGTVYGVIAQQVKDVLPEAVRLMTNMIPSVMQTSLAIDKDTTTTPPTYTITLPTQHNVPNGAKVRIANHWIDDSVNSEVIEDVVCEVITNVTLKVQLSNEVFAYLDSVFVYGHEVNDFYALDKSKIFMPLIGAVQELDKKCKSQQETITSLNSVILTLTSEINAIKAHVGL